MTFKSQRLNYTDARCSLFHLQLIYVGMITAIGSVGCSEQKQETKAPLQQKASTPENHQNDSLPVVSQTKKLMGTLFSVTIIEKDSAKADRIIDAAFKEIKRVENLLSEWRNDSEISQINNAAGGESVRVGQDTLEVIKAGLAVSKWSEGAFDLSWAALRGLYVFKPDNPRLPQPKELKERLPYIRYQDIILDEKQQTVRLRRKGMQIGVGGIAKGLALDRVSSLLKQASVENYMLFAGGQVQVHGKRGDRAWRVGIRHPRRHDYFAVLTATNGSISTSGDYEQVVMQNGKRWHHLLNPRTGIPVRHTTSVTVLAKQGIYADALSTAVFIMGYEKAISKLPTAPGNPEIVVVDKDLTVHWSNNIMKILSMQLSLQNGRLPP